MYILNEKRYEWNAISLLSNMWIYFSSHWWWLKCTLLLNFIDAFVPIKERTHHKWFFFVWHQVTFILSILQFSQILCYFPWNDDTFVEKSHLGPEEAEGLIPSGLETREEKSQYRRCLSLVYKKYNDRI